uniref:Uncharacterized protein n=1 Tax=Tanacetum cinerariifolium TaxID=118510 RepID=A0A6L2K929_TANCI|nr:hypothetical protein [Tanacetum cinerariifolium]
MLVVSGRCKMTDPHMGTSYSLPPEETGYSLPHEETGYSLPPEKTGYSLPLEGTSYSLVIAFKPEVLISIGGALISSGGFDLVRRFRYSSGGFGRRIPFSSSLLAVLQYFKVHISQLVPLGEIFLIDCRAISFHMPWRHPDSCITDKVPTSFNQKHVDQLKAHIAKLCDIPKVVLARSGLSRVWRNLICDPALRRSDNTVMSIYDFLSMPFLDKVTVREEPHGLDTFILGRVTDRTTSPALAGTTITRASSEEIIVTRPDRKVATKANHAAKRKASTGPEISTNVVKKTRSNKKGSRAGSSGQVAGDEVC